MPETKNATVENNTMNGDIVRIGTSVGVSPDNIVLKNNN